MRLGLLKEKLPSTISFRGRDICENGPVLDSYVVGEERNVSCMVEQPKSTVLVLSGSNWVEDSAIQLNWLSFVSVWMATEIQRSSRTLSFFCQTEDRLVSRRKRRTFQDVVCSLNYQLAEQRPLGTGAASRRPGGCLELFGVAKY